MAKKEEEKKLTEQQIEFRRKSALTVIKSHKTLLDPEFWAQDYVDAELLNELQTALNEMADKIKEAKAQIKLKELEAMGIDTSAFKIKFS